jgi:predicted cupin superfamily sugar epimerase
MDGSIQDAAYWITTLVLEPHPEGGYYKETYRSSLEVTRSGDELTKAACTSIYYLLEKDDYSGFHRLQSDEIWYFHKGKPLIIYIITPDGELQFVELSDKPSGAFFATVKAGCWFAARLQIPEDYVLVSCVVAPGFDFKEFEMAEKYGIIKLFPQHADLLNQLCRL